MGKCRKERSKEKEKTRREKKRKEKKEKRKKKGKKSPSDATQGRPPDRDRLNNPDGRTTTEAAYPTERRN